MDSQRVVSDKRGERDKWISRQTQRKVDRQRERKSE